MRSSKDSISSSIDKYLAVIVLLFSGILHDIVHTVVLVVTVGQVDDGHCGVGPHGDGGTHQGPCHGRHLQLQDRVLHHALAIPASCQEIIRLLLTIVNNRDSYYYYHLYHYQSCRPFQTMYTITNHMYHYTITNLIPLYHYQPYIRLQNHMHHYTITYHIDQYKSYVPLYHYQSYRPLQIICTIIPLPII